MESKQTADQFQDWYKKNINRSTHLCIVSADGKSTSEIAGLDTMTSGLKLTVRLVFDREQSCIELKAELEIEDVTSTRKRQEMLVRFYADAAEYPADWQCSKVIEEKDLPPGLAAIQNARKYLNEGELWVLDLEYLKSNIVAEGLYDRLRFNEPTKLRCVDILRQLFKVTDVKLFIHLRSEDFSQALNQLKKKMRAELHVPPFHEYIAKSGRYTLDWGNNQFPSTKDTYERGFKRTFRKAQYHRLTHGYGVMRDSTVQLKSVENAIDTPMRAAFVAMPGPKTDTGLPIYYLAFVECDSAELIHDVYPVGESGTFCFEQPPRNAQPSGWQYTIKPPIPRYNYPGNLVMQITRARDDVRELIVSPEPQPFMNQEEVWAYPNASDLAPRRLIDCANLITSLGTDADELRRYVCALDLHEKETAHGLFSKMTESQTAIVNQLLSTLSPSQLGAFEHIKQSKHDIVFIQGPPGTGKTTFIVTFLQILWQLNHSWIACAPSNSATDHLATVLQQKCPEMGATRFHSYDNEARAIRRQEQDLNRQEETEDQVDDKNEDKADDKSDGKAEVREEQPISQDAETQRVFHAYIAELQQKDSEWKGKLGRPNFKDMGLNMRALQNAGVIEHDIQCFAPTVHDVHADFRESLKNRDFVGGEGKTAEDFTRYKLLEDQLMIDTMRKSSGIITTLSKTADNRLKSAKKPVIAIIDEACQSTELETLLVWAHNTETLVQIIFLGDPLQLRGTVMTSNQNTDDNLVNPFAKQMVISFFERLWRRDFPTYMITEQHRLASGLEEVFNELFYQRKITNAECTMLHNRPGAQKAIDYVHKKYSLRDGIPHLCLNVADGVCLRGALKSRYNPQNIAATTNIINSMLVENLWTEDDISVITPYREQAALYRKVFRQQSLFRIQVFTADSVQGRENNCTIFDIVLAFERTGGWGFVKEGFRLNVAISRSREQFILVCDLAALNPNKRHTQQLEQLGDKEREERTRVERDMSKHLRGLFNYFEVKKMVHTQKAETLSEISLIDMQPVKEFRQGIRM